MKRILLILLTLLFIQSNFSNIAEAGFIADYKLRIEKERQIKSIYDDVKSVMDKQEEYSNNYDIEGLAKLYSSEFVNCDGFNKDVYFKLIKDTWQTYPNISYTTKIKNIIFNEKYAKVEVFETANATTNEIEPGVAARGELYSAANGVYYLEKVGQNWVIMSEQIIDEKSILRYGDARFIKMDLNAPSLVPAGKYYTTSLVVDVPEDAVVIASIGNATSVYPQVKTDDSFRKLPDDNILERMFAANKKNVNEYAVASVGIAKSEPLDKEKIKVYMSGLAFIMTRVNVIPENKFIKFEDDNGKPE